MVLLERVTIDSGGSATFSLSGLAVGNYSVHAHYYGDVTFGPAISDAVTFQVLVPGPTSVTLKITNLPHIAGLPLTTYALPSAPGRIELITLSVTSALPVDANIQIFVKKSPNQVPTNPLVLIGTVNPHGANSSTVSLGASWDYKRLGVWLFQFKFAGDVCHLATELQADLIFHYFPHNGRYLLPASHAVKNTVVPFYTTQWKAHYGYTFNTPFNGFTTGATSLLECNYNQSILNPSTPTQIGYAWMGFPLIGPQSAMHTTAGVHSFEVSQFAIGERLYNYEHFTQAESQYPLDPTAINQAHIWGTYCLNASNFQVFAH